MATSTGHCPCVVAARPFVWAGVAAAGSSGTWVEDRSDSLPAYRTVLPCTGVHHSIGLHGNVHHGNGRHGIGRHGNDLHGNDHRGNDHYGNGRCGSHPKAGIPDSLFSYTSS